MQTHSHQEYTRLQLTEYLLLWHSASILLNSFSSTQGDRQHPDPVPWSAELCLRLRLPSRHHRLSAYTFVRKCSLLYQAHQTMSRHPNCCSLSQIGRASCRERV